MTLFWVASVIIVALSLILVAWPFLIKKSNNDLVLRDELNKAFYKDRLTELDEESQEGLVNNQQELIEDLKQSLLDDIPEENKTRIRQSLSPWMILLPSLVIVVVLSYGLYMKFGAANKVLEWQQVSANLPALSKKLMAPQEAAFTDEEMRDLTLALRTRLHYKPNDSTGWLLLGRIALANRDVETSIGAMKNAYRLEPENGDVNLGYAQALMLSGDELDQNSARTILGQLVQREYVDVRVFSLLAFDAYERKDYPAAMRYWRVMQQMVGPQDSRYEMLSRNIENAQKRIGAPLGQSQSVTISLSDSVDIDPKSALIVSVHTADGAAMPVAAARYPLGAFPRTVILDDSNSMLAERKLSSLDSLMVRVRLDGDGNVATKQGDWFGESKVVKLGDHVEVIIDSRYQ
ncbi:c-type cytochrome biogenesis protein CcmI [Vibrio ostreicida]|uniref:c-type cytochrome biogenesis protein CcmI n=1 Tax=Vibrio ostreicida TaxID=526588 RepID=UPI003B5A9846